MQAKKAQPATPRAPPPTPTALKPPLLPPPILNPMAHPLNNAARTSLPFPHPITTDDSSHASATTPAHSWFARLLNVKPVERILCLTIPRDRVVRVIHSVLREWRRYGVREINVDKGSSCISAVVGEDNTFGVKPVTLLCEVFPVAMKGRASGMAVARFSQVKGAKSSFSRAVEGMEGVLRGNRVVVKNKRWGREMRRCLRDWEGEGGTGSRHLRGR